MLRQTGAVITYVLDYVASRDQGMIDTHFDEKKIQQEKKFLRKKVGASSIVVIIITNY